MFTHKVELRSEGEILVAAMLECLPRFIANDDVHIIYTLRWQGFSLKEIQTHIEEIKQRRAHVALKLENLG